MSRTIVFVGTYAGSDDAAIQAFELDAKGDLRPLSTTSGIQRPAFLVLTADGRFLYTVCERADKKGDASGCVAAFRVDPRNLSLAPINEQPSHGAGPCHLDLDPAARTLLVANYSGGSVASYPLRPDGSIGEAGSVIRHQGSSVDPRRQEGPHPHSINVDPGGRYAFVADLGTDQVLCYRLDPAAGTIAEGAAPAALAPGAGPRHLDFSRDGRRVYVINELDSTVTAFARDAGGGALSPIGTVTTLPAGWEGTNYPADIHVSPDGRFVYGSNRGHDSIAIFSVDAATGALAPAGHEPTRGGWPRGFALSPRGDFLVAANQNSDNVLSFAIDRDSGRLRPTGAIRRVPSPTCVQISELSDGG